MLASGYAFSAFLAGFAYGREDAGASEGVEAPSEEARTVFRAEASGEELAYRRTVASLVARYEASSGVKLTPAVRPEIGLKLSTRFAPGLATPRRLVDALLDLLKKRGYERDVVFLLDLEERGLRRAGYMPPPGEALRRYRGHPVYALDEGKLYNDEWFHDSPLPPAKDFRARLLLRYPGDRESRLREERRSYLPAPLFLEEAHWINLPVLMDDLHLGLDAAAANASLRAVNNNVRFFGHATTTPASAAEILAIPEYWEKHLFSLIDLSRFQYAGSGNYNASFIASEPTLLLSENPFSLDYVAQGVLNVERVREGFEQRSRKNSQLFRFAKELGLAEVEKSKVENVP